MKPAEVELIREARNALGSGRALAIRQTHGLSLAELAILADVDASTLWRWEKGRNVPKGARAVRYALALRMLDRAEPQGAEQ
jgi:transcriptional regulator with XRE-family HTH domain